MHPSDKRSLLQTGHIAVGAGNRTTARAWACARDGEPGPKRQISEGAGRAAAVLVLLLCGTQDPADFRETAAPASSYLSDPACLFAGLALS